MIEASLNKNSFGQNTRYTGGAALAQQIYHLITMKKGTDPLNFDKGCDANSYYYAFADSMTLATLKNEITSQISTYTPYIPSNVVCQALRNTEGKFILHIIVYIENYDKALIVSTNGMNARLSLTNIA